MNKENWWVKKESKWKKENKSAKVKGEEENDGEKKKTPKTLSIKVSGNNASPMNKSVHYFFLLVFFI